VPTIWHFCKRPRSAELHETVAALESQVHSDEISAHSLNAALSGKDEEIARLEALRGADEEGGEDVDGGFEEAAVEVEELMSIFREKEAMRRA
jgi:hypothetical protein